VKRSSISGVIHRGSYLLLLLFAGVGLVAFSVSALSPGSTAQAAPQTASAADQHPEFPPGVGRDTVLHLCVKCHSPNIILAYGQNRTGWENTITKMVQKGAEGEDEDFAEIADYLTEHFPPSTVQKVFVNMANEKQLSDVLEISLDDAKAIVAYRDKAKGFNSIEDMKMVPNVDTKKIDAKKDRLVFGAGVKPDAK
jgi:competence protein ComEA